ncbi:MAG: acetate/propionate family kinase [Rhizomicrobium sp.]
MTDTILTLNAGSSSIKFTMFAAGADVSRKTAICDGEIDGLRDVAHFTAKDSNGTSLIDRRLANTATHENALRALLKWFEEKYADRRLVAAGHRVVHGGARFTAPVRIDAEVVAELCKLVSLAPLHQPHNLAAIEALSKLHPALPQIACFDTAFHHTQSPVATAFALPRALSDQGIRRYGFHGLSYEYIASVLPHVLGPDTAEGRVIVAHLGSGASLCAMHSRKSVATTMGFTALDGLMMGRRCGAIDPGVVLYLLQEQKMPADAISDLLYDKSGLLGVSGISDDMRDLLASNDTRAREAVDLFVYRITRELGSLVAALGGLDALVFTAGIGEHAAEIRRRVCVEAEWLGIKIDEKANASGGPCISDSHVSAWIVPTDEDLMIARHAYSVLNAPVAGA